ncbi:phospholipase [Helicobacter muridarum]|uniref:Phosphatidylcholine 1-acylhydrolase n=1 Tax=Helicobacter muridarum TaxID=216 RepID=A0A377PSH0_9HELI|nr:phospholipase A [Helicobacter muridarum]TLE01386.1 phospholipase [Helicobacter muridarum]STQ85314.1 phospholipase A [Helicobacter muridarum]
MLNKYLYYKPLRAAILIFLTFNLQVGVIYASSLFDKIEASKRVAEAEKSYENYLKLLEHEGTYMIYYYSFQPHGIYGGNIPGELKFQLSIKLPIWRGAFWTKGTLFFAHTQTMFFQQFNRRLSNPVRDTDYKPSIFYSYPGNWNFLGITLKELRLGLTHYSNGIGGEECIRNDLDDPTPRDCRSRSAGNRIIFETILEYPWKSHVFGAQISLWPYISYRRDNPDLAKFMGYGNLRIYYKYDRHFAEIHINPIFSNYAKYHGSIRLGYAFRLNKFISIYGQYFYGYGDNLFEYNIISHRLGIGLRSSIY